MSDNVSGWERKKKKNSQVQSHREEVRRRSMTHTHTHTHTGTHTHRGEYNELPRSKNSSVFLNEQQGTTAIAAAATAAAREGSGWHDRKCSGRQKRVASFRNSNLGHRVKQKKPSLALYKFIHMCLKSIKQGLWGRHQVRRCILWNSSSVINGDFK